MDSKIATPQLLSLGFDTNAEDATAIGKFCLG
jgi:hypothetical protein